jgi:hypothetical protein
LRYAYPMIQFKVIEKTPKIIGIGEGIEILQQVFLEVDHLSIGNQTMVLNEKSVEVKAVDFGQVDQPYEYRFLTPWMALNQENYKKYNQLDWKEKRTFLERILAGNLKSLSKAVEYFIPDFEKLHIEGTFNEVSRNFKNNKMLCFAGTFTTNFLIPELFSIGKQAARGFGVVGKN